MKATLLINRDKHVKAKTGGFHFRLHIYIIKYKGMEHDDGHKI